MAAVLYLSTYFQVLLNADTMHSEIDSLSMIIPVMICSVSSGIFTSKTVITKAVAILGARLASARFGLLTTLDHYSSSAKRIGYLIIPGVGIGLSFQSLTLNCQVAAPKANGGLLIATSMLAFFRATGGVVGSTLGQTIRSVVFKPKIDGKLLDNVDAADFVNSPKLIRQLPEQYQGLIIDGFVIGFQRVMYFSLGLILTAFIIELFFTNKRIPRGGPHCALSPCPSP